jgi:hypothetical protein
MILIIGAGISGLFTGYSLLKKGIDFRIVEKGTIGGKIKTERYGDTNVEFGPSVIHSNQKNIVNLCRELNINLKESSGSFYSFTELLDLKKLPSGKRGQVRDYLTPENCSVYYETEYALFDDFIKGVKTEGKYLYPEGGFEDIVNRLRSILKHNIFKGAINSVSDHCIVSMIVNDKRIVKRYTSIICCISMRQLYKIVKFSIPKNITKTMSSVRVYARFDKNLSEINHVFENKVIYYPYGGLCIKMSHTVLMLSYTDGDNTNRIEIEKCLRFFGLENNLVDFLIVYYKDAYDLVTSRTDLPVKIGQNIFQSSFPDRYNQAWLEGNLIQCNKIIEMNLF